MGTMEAVPSAPTMSFNYEDDDAPPPAYDGGENDDYLPTYGAISAQVNEGFSPGDPGAVTSGNHVVVDIGGSDFEIGQWLKGIGPHYYDEYHSVFVDNGFDSKISLQTLTDSDLQAIGVSKLGHRKALMAEIERFN